MRWNFGMQNKNKNKMRKIIFAIGCWLLTTCLFSQPNVHQVIFLNEGHYDYNNQVQTVPVTIGSYSPLSAIYSVKVTIRNARFGSDVIIEGQFF